MLRVLTLSSLFPNGAQPTFGIFVERQTLGLAAMPEVELEVVAPVGLPLWPLSHHPHYARRLRLPATERWKGVPVHRPRFTVWPRLGETNSAAAMARALIPYLKRLRRKFPFDVIDSEFFWPDGVAAMMVARELCLPFSVKARGSDIEYWGRRHGVAEQILAASRSAAGLLAVSESLKWKMIAMGMPGEKIRVHRTGIDADRFQPVDRSAAKATLGVEGPLVATVAALVPNKGQRLAIEALERLPAATLMLIGDGPEREALEALAAGPAVAGRVRILGNRPHEEVAHLVAAADVMLLPTEAEGLANAWVESLACGTPVVTTDLPESREVFTGPDAGRLVPRDPEAIAAAIGTILASPPDPLAVRAFVSGFSWQRNAEELFRHLSALAAPSVRPAAAEPARSFG